MDWMFRAGLVEQGLLQYTLLDHARNPAQKAYATIASPIGFPMLYGVA
jgi:hypothetical protein